MYAKIIVVMNCNLLFNMIRNCVYSDVLCTAKEIGYKLPAKYKGIETLSVGFERKAFSLPAFFKPMFICLFSSEGSFYSTLERTRKNK
jgi:hypothetical protein